MKRKATYLLFAVAMLAAGPVGAESQAHTVRGAISGMIKKRLGCEVVAEQGADGQRTYRIV